MTRSFLFLGAINGLLTVALGAFAAHGLTSRLTSHALEVFHTGVDYQGLHALALLAVGLLAQRRSASVWMRASGWTFAAGILLFSGSLYGLATTGATWMGLVTPVGGILLLTGWTCLAVAVLRD